jgi:ABC-2 type transport system permease protein
MVIASDVGPVVRAIVVIAAKDLLQRGRDRSALIMGLVAPLALVFILDATLGGTGDGDGPAFDLAVVNNDDGEVGAAFDDMFDALVADGVADGRRVEDREALDRLVDDGTVHAGFVLDAGLTDRVIAGEPTTITVVGDPGSLVAVMAAEAVATAFAAEVDHFSMVSTALVGRDETGGGASGSTSGTLDSLSVEPPLALDRSAAEGRGYDNTTYYAVSMAVFFLFFTVQFGVLSLLDERQQGTLDRLLLAPVGPSTVLIAKLMASLVVGLATMAVLVVSTTVVVGAQWGGLGPVALLVVVGVLVAVSLALVAAGVAKTTEQAGVVSTILAVVLGLLGGAFFPVSEGPSYLNLLSYVSPHRWLLDGFREVSYGGGLVEVTTPLLALAVMLASTGAVGFLTAQRRLTPG